MYSAKHNTYTVISTQLATCCVYSDPFSGQYLEPEHVASYVLINLYIYICVLCLAECITLSYGIKGARGGAVV